MLLDALGRLTPRKFPEFTRRLIFQGYKHWKGTVFSGSEKHALQWPATKKSNCETLWREIENY